MPSPELTERERRVLEAIIQSYVETAEPAGSRTISRRFGLGVSPATIRNTMSDLEEKGFLFHPHTSAGRVPTDLAYRVYVDSLIRFPTVAREDQHVLKERIGSRGSTIDAILQRAAQSLGIVSQELGIALGPRLDQAILHRIELVRLSSERILMVLALEGGDVRTIFVEVKGEIAHGALTEVAFVLNQRLGGLPLRDIRSSLGTRLRDVGTAPEASELLNVFVEQGGQLFDVAPATDNDGVVLGQASVLAEQPEFSSGDSMRRLIELTDTRHDLAALLRARSTTSGVSITIGNEHEDPRLERFTVVTAEYRAGGLSGVIGVIGPTRLNYARVVPMVDFTAQALSRLMG